MIPKYTTSGYFTLGSPAAAPPLPTFNHECSGNLIGARSRGQWCLETDMLKPGPLQIPSRDKTVHVWGSQEFADSIRNIDSELPGHAYADKLRVLTRGSGLIVNSTRDTHGSLALVILEPLYVYGLYDVRLQAAFLMWSTDPDRFREILNSDPLRFSLYRFPVTTSNHLFIQGEAICSKWSRWLRKSNSTLYAFNALEHRLYGPP